MEFLLDAVDRSVLVDLGILCDLFRIRPKPLRGSPDVASHGRNEP